MSRHLIDENKWAALTLFEQMGNIGSEVTRSMNALQHGDDSSLMGAYFRGLDLIDTTVSCWSSEARRRELLRARELFCTSVESRQVDKSLDTYFLQFAVAARIAQEK